MSASSCDLERPFQAIRGLGDHPLLEDYRDLKDVELSRRRNAFIAESEVVLRVLLSHAPQRLRSVLLAEPRLLRLRPLLEGLLVPVFVAPQAVLDAITGFHIHRGVLAAGEREPVPRPAELLAELGPGVRRVVVLEGLTNHDNVGGVFRNAAAFGADAVLYDRATCDPLYRKAIRVSAGAVLRVPYARAEHTRESLDALSAAGFSLLALSPQSAATELSALSLPERVALLLGSEGPGLRKESMAAADAIVRIDIEPSFDSLNVATASGIALYALRIKGDQREENHHGAH